MKVHTLTFPVIVIMMCSIWLTMMNFAGLTDHGRTLDLIKIECFQHRDNADVHKLCVDHGYDR